MMSRKDLRITVHNKDQELFDRLKKKTEAEFSIKLTNNEFAARFFVQALREKGDM